LSQSRHADALHARRLQVSGLARPRPSRISWGRERPV